MEGSYRGGGVEGEVRVRGPTGGEEILGRGARKRGE
jgi:hypothetical protein